MQNLIHSLLLVSLLLVGSTTNTSAQTIKSLPNLSTIINDDRVEEILRPNRMCDVTAVFNVLIATPKIAGVKAAPTLTLSPGYHPMYVVGKLGSTESTIELGNTFEFMTTSFNPITLNYYHIYRQSYELTHNTAEACAHIGKNELLDLGWQANLLTSLDGGTTHIPYPICDHTSIGDIFSCEAFAETQDACSGGSCDSEDLHEMTGDVLVDCDACIDKVRPEKSVHRSGNPQNSLFSSLQIAPNPFQDVIKIEWETASSSSIQLSIWDASGKKVWEQVAGRDVGDHIRVRTSQLPNGLYLLCVQAEGHQQLLKIAKQ
ncbi:MAG: T9SS type A sorting domain-containing protein [Bacteroidota bacterium]